MRYKVEFSEPAKGDIQSLFAYIAQRSPQGAGAWERTFEAASQSLRSSPSAFSLAPENEDHREEIRQFSLKIRKGSAYGGLFPVSEELRWLIH